jgi:hypothetical protein
MALFYPGMSSKVLRRSGRFKPSFLRKFSNILGIIIRGISLEYSRSGRIFSQEYTQLTSLRFQLDTSCIRVTTEPFWCNLQYVTWVAVSFELQLRVMSIRDSDLTTLSALITEKPTAS